MCTWVARQDRRMAFEIEAFQVAIGMALVGHIAPPPLNTHTYSRIAGAQFARCIAGGGKRVHAMRDAPAAGGDVGTFG